MCSNSSGAKPCCESKRVKPPRMRTLWHRSSIIQVKNTLYDRENILALKDDLLQRQQAPVINPLVLPGVGEIRREVYETDWQERRYPDLEGMSRDEQRSILYDKMVCDAMIDVQMGLLWALPLYFTILFIVPAVEALAAGSLWRRYQRPWPVTSAYAERIIPLALSLILFGILALTAFLLRSMMIEGWFGTFERAYWRWEVALAALVTAQVAAWRGWYWPLRLLLHAAWIALVVYARA